jgi:putative ABC transport system substrate-binding protein
MRRREFLQAVGGAAGAWPLTAGAEPTLRSTIGVLFPGASTFRLGPVFLAGLSDLGFIEGQTVAVEYRFAEGRYERLPALAADLVARKVDVIVGYAAPGGLAAKAATLTIPVVFVTGVDPSRSAWSRASIDPEATSQGRRLWALCRRRNNLGWSTNWFPWLTS